MFRLIRVVRYLSMYAPFVALRDDKKGASLAEYALLLGLITGAVVLTIAALSGAIGDVITATTGLISPGEGEGEVDPGL